MVRNGPVEVAALEVVHALLLDAVGNADVDSVGGEHAMDLRQHLSCIGARAIAAQNRVERALVDNCVERAILILKLAHVHLFVDHAWVALFVLFGHLLLDGERDVNIAQVLVPVVKHLLREACSIIKKTSLEKWLRQPTTPKLIYSNLDSSPSRTISPWEQEEALLTRVAGADV